MNEQHALQNVLRSRLDTLRIRYPAYSVRAFARKAGLSPATLSLLLQGKRNVSLKLAQKVSDKLGFDPQERAAVLGELLAARHRRPAVLGAKQYTQLSTDQYRLLADWRAFALLSLIQIDGFRSDPRWIARRLGITSAEARETLARLRRLEMIAEHGGKMTRTTSRYRTSDDIANLSLRQSHAQTLELAQASLDEIAVELRDFTWLTFPLDLRKLDAAKTMIRKFQDDLVALIDDDAKPTEVYRLAVQLFPLTKNQAD